MRRLKKHPIVYSILGALLLLVIVVGIVGASKRASSSAGRSSSSTSSSSTSTPAVAAKPRPKGTKPTAVQRACLSVPSSYFSDLRAELNGDANRVTAAIHANDAQAAANALAQNSRDLLTLANDLRGNQFPDVIVLRDDLQTAASDTQALAETVASGVTPNTTASTADVHAVLNDENQLAVDCRAG